ncbi:MAG TPA: hypothetical protein VFZ73_16810 [Gemmatimonadaceae bacterium]
MSALQYLSKQNGGPGSRPIPLLHVYPFTRLPEHQSSGPPRLNPVSAKGWLKTPGNGSSVPGSSSITGIFRGQDVEFQVDLSGGIDMDEMAARERELFPGLAEVEEKEGSPSAD